MTSIRVHSHDGGVDDLLVWYLIANSQDRGPVKNHNIASEGCVSAEQAAENAALFHSWVPKAQLYRASFPKYSQPPTVERFFGENGLNNCDLKALVQRPRVFLPEVSLSPPTYCSDMVDWLETGPCTTLARVLSQASTPLRKWLRSVTIMGGVLEQPGIVGKNHPDTAAPCAEFNFYHDAAAAKTLIAQLNSEGILPRLVSWDCCREVFFCEEQLQNLRGINPLSEALRKVVLRFFALYGSDMVPGAPTAVYAPADTVAWYASLDAFGTSEECGISIVDDVHDPLYGYSLLDPNSPLRVERFLVRDIPELKKQLCEDLGWLQ